MSDLDGKVALVTGGGSGLGRASAIAFANEGASVVVADIDEAGGAATVEAVEAAGTEAVFLRTDVTQESQVEALVAGAVARFGRLDCALNNAGTTGPGAFTADYSVEDWNRTITLNLTSVFLCLRQEIPVMLAGGGGTIVNMASGAGLMGFAGLPAYVASKHGVLGLTRASALQYARRGLRINAVCPGGVRTPIMYDNLPPDANMAAINQAHPIGRVAEPSEIAAAILWLASPDSGFVIGHGLAIDGGLAVQ